MAFLSALPPSKSGPLGCLHKTCCQQPRNSNVKPHCIVIGLLMALSAPALAQDRIPTLFLIGDSTVHNGSGTGENKQWGWGEPIAELFDRSKIHVVNSARGGRSSRTFITEGLWDRVLADLQPGDFVIMQFGHNDSGPLDDAARARGSLKGISQETREIENPVMKKPESVRTFGWYMRKYVEDTRAKGATPIVCSLVPRKIWADGNVVRGSASYGGWAQAVAKAEGAAFVDLNEIVARKYEALGQPGVEKLFADEHTHTTLAGAELNAAAVVEGLQALNPNPLAAFFASTPKP